MFVSRAGECRTAGGHPCCPGKSLDATWSRKRWPDVAHLRMESCLSVRSGVSAIRVATARTQEADEGLGLRQVRPSRLTSRERDVVCMIALANVTGRGRQPRGLSRFCEAADPEDIPEARRLESDVRGRKSDRDGRAKEVTRSRSKVRLDLVGKQLQSEGTVIQRFNF